MRYKKKYRFTKGEENNNLKAVLYKDSGYQRPIVNTLKAYCLNTDKVVPSVREVIEISLPFFGGSIRIQCSECILNVDTYSPTHLDILSNYVQRPLAGGIINAYTFYHIILHVVLLKPHSLR